MKHSRLAATLYLFLATFLLAASTAFATPMAYLGYEPTQHTAFVKGDSCCKWLHDDWNDPLKFVITRQTSSDTALQQVWLSKTMANEGSQSLGVWLKHNTNTIERQREEFQLANSFDFRPKLDQTIFYGFAVYIHPNSVATLRKGVIFTQAWQVHDTSSSKNPPFDIRFNDDSDYTYTIYTSTDVPGTDDRSTHGTQTPIYTSSAGLEKGVWHEFVVMFRPSVRYAGAVKVWQDGQLLVSLSNHRNFGYVPQTTDPFITNRLEYRFGAYRVTGPIYPGDVILLYDQAKIGHSYEDVDP